MTIAGRTFRQLIDEVLEFQFAPGKYEGLTKKWLVDAVRIIVRQAEIRTAQEAVSYSTTSGDGSLELPANFARLIDLHDEEENRLIPQLSLVEYDTLEEGSGRPMTYAVAGNELLLYPTPDGVYKFGLRYWRLPEDMVADSDEPELPILYHSLPVAYALMKCYARENDWNAMGIWKAEWEAGLLKARGELVQETEDSPRQVAGSWGDPHEVRPAVWR